MSISHTSANLQLDTKRHSFAHLMAAAVSQMFPKTQFGVGPVIENGCYYDFILPRPFVPEDLPILEAKIQIMLKSHLSFKYQEYSLNDTIIHFQKANQPLKVELLENLRDKGRTSMDEEDKELFGESAHLGAPQSGGGVLKTEKLGILLYNPDLLEKATKMRNEPSLMETRFWCESKNYTQFENIKINRQKPILEYIVDFYLPQFGVAIELDGESHNNQLEYDKNRTLELENLGITVLRFTNDEIKNNLDEVFAKIVSIINTLRPADTSQGRTIPKITLYRITDEKTGEIIFEDLCKGPHIEHVKELKGLGFALDKFSASYWRGDQARGINMQRLYALVFETKEELQTFQSQREEAKKRDHRILGQQQEIFMISEDVGAGLPLYLPNGATIRQLLEKYCYQEAKKSGYQYVYTPHIGKSDLFAKSGHLDHYADGMYAPIDMVNLKGEGAEMDGKTEKFYLKPMNCPMHHQIYLNKPRSYRELPYRLYEYGTVYRYEESGTLTGLIRVRGFTQNDAHVYCQTNQMKEVIEEALNRMTKTYADVGIKDYKIRFSLPDFVNEKEKFGEETQEWRNAVLAMRTALDELRVEYYEAIGEAAFYGPKIDIQVKNVNSKEDSLSTIQVDYSIAPKFGITFKNTLGEDEVPAIIHMALMGSVDRFMAFMLEMTGGRLPFWLAPVQLKILTINNSEEVMNYVTKIKTILEETVLMKPLKYNEIRFEIDDRQETLGKKIREGEMSKIPVLLIAGPKDIAENQVSVRTQGGEEKVKLEDLGEFLKNLG